MIRDIIKLRISKFFISRKQYLRYKQLLLKAELVKVNEQQRSVRLNAK